MISEMRQIEARVLLQRGEPKGGIYTEEEYADLLDELRTLHRTKVGARIYPDFVLFAAPYGAKAEVWKRFAKEVQMLFTSTFHEPNPLAEAEYVI
jgi:hypothetical protein